MNVLAIMTSPQKNKSSSNNLTHAFLGELDKIYSNIEIQKINLHDLKLNYCLGCCHCFENDSCCQNDDLNLLIKKIKNADLIVLSSPVYFHTIPAILKNLIDRLSFWSHRIELAGKLGVIITASHTSGNSETSAQINKFFTYIGLHTASIINFQIIDNQLKTKENIKAEAKKVVELYNSDKIITSIASENIFQLYKEKCLVNKGINQYDRSLFIERGILNYKNYLEYFNSKRRYIYQKE